MINWFFFYLDEILGKFVGCNIKVNFFFIENCYLLIIVFDLDEVVLRIWDFLDLNKWLLCVNFVKSDDRLECSDNNLSNGDLVVNGLVFVVINGNLCMLIGLLYKDVSFGDIEFCILLNSLGYELKCDMIVMVDIDDIIFLGGVRFCCLVFCYCESVCCDNYKEFCIWRSWYGLCYYVCVFVEYKYFEWFILFMIVISSLILVSFKSLFVIDLRVVWIKVYLL